MPSAAGFKYGTTSGNLSQTASSTASGTEGNLSATLSGLTAGTTYYYKAFATVSGTGDYANSSSTFYGDTYSFITKKVATATVSTDAAGALASTSAQLNGSFSGASGAIYETGFYWGTTSNPATAVTGSGSNASSGSFSYTLTSLTASTTYYYKAFVREYNEESGQYVERTGSVLSFTTTSGSQQTTLPGYLGCYEMPAVSLQDNTFVTGSETFGSATWVRHQTSSSSQRIVTHRYYYDGSSKTSDSGTLYRNYTALVDQNKRCALWTAYPMHATAYANNDTGRVGDFSTTTSYDKAIPNSWQSSGATVGDYNNGNGYARGHHCASEDRQTTQIANQQTFYYTNQSPQWQNSFNGGIWATLEGRVQTMAPTGRDTLYVVVGVLFEGNNTHASNDGGDVGLPSHFYKCLMKCSFNTSGTMTDAKGIAFIYSNEPHSGNYYASDFVTSINTIEQRSGFDFFANVPSNLQEPAEENLQHSWFTGVTTNNVAPISGNDWGSL